MLGATVVATAGSPTRLVVTAKDLAKDGTPVYRIAIIGLNLGLAGTLPIRPQTPTLDRIAIGMAIPATTLALVGFEEGKIRVDVPLPFKLSNDPPNGGYTPAPLRTAAPIINRRRPAPGSSPSPAGSPAPSAAPTLLPQPGPSNASSTLPRPPQT